MKKTRKIYLVTAVVALAFAGGHSAFAKATSDDENSVYNWGPWDKMVSPAAGPSSIVPDALAFNVPDDYEERRDPRRDEEFACPPGGLCGYGNMVTESWWGDYWYSSGGDGGESSPVPLMIGVFLDPEADWEKTSWHPNSGNFPGMDGAEFWSDIRKFERSEDDYDEGLYRLYYPWDEQYDEGGESWYETWNEGRTLTHEWDGGEGAPFNGTIMLKGLELRTGTVGSTGTMPFHFPDDEYDVWKSGSYGDIWGCEDGSDGYSWTEWREGYRVEVDLRPVLGDDSGIYRVWYREVSDSYEYEYYDGGDNGYYDGAEGYYDGAEGYESERVRGLFLVGIPSTVGEVGARGDVQAHYSGAYFSGAQRGDWQNGSTVEIDVDFGDSSWSGQWNGGSDGSNIDTYDTLDGKTRVNGEVGFSVEQGTISGATFVADGASITAGDGVIESGHIEGFFVGSGASSMIGNADIVKTVPDVYENAVHVSTFGAIEVEQPQ